MNIYLFFLAMIVGIFREEVRCFLLRVFPDFFIKYAHIILVGLTGVAILCTILQKCL